MVPPERVARVGRAVDDEHRRRQAELEQQRPGMLEHPRVTVIEGDGGEPAPRAAFVQALDELAQREHVVAQREPTQLLGKWVKREKEAKVATQLSGASW